MTAKRTISTRIAIFACAEPLCSRVSATVLMIIGAATRCSQNPCAERRVTRCGSLPSKAIATAKVARPSASVTQPKPLVPEKTKMSETFPGVPFRVAARTSAVANRPSAISAIAKGTLKRSQKTKIAATVSRPGKIRLE
jgi:hypothetical protein